MSTYVVQKQWWFRVALINFFLAACMGALLRFAFVQEIAWVKYKFLLHGHSHVAMLGWIYLGLYALLIHTFASHHHQKLFRNLFFFTEICVIGMFISFPIQGYGAFAIAFSTGHVICSYCFAFYLFKSLPPPKLNKPGVLLACTAIGFMLLSTLGIWALPIIIINDLKHSMLYYMSVQYFLHFQLNGWFVFGILALLFNYFEKELVAVAVQDFKRFYYFLVIGTILTFALAIAWSKPISFIFWLNSLGGLVQLLALLYLLKILKTKYVTMLKSFSKVEGYLLKIILISYILKIIMQTIVIIPYVATIAYTIRNYMMGFIHLLLLGMISSALFLFASHSKLIAFKSKSIQFGILCFLIGLVGSEGILFFQGTLFWLGLGFLPAYYILLFIFSATIALGTAIMNWSLLIENRA